MKYLLVALLSSVLTFTGICWIYFTSLEFGIGEQIYFSNEDQSFTLRCVPTKGSNYSELIEHFEKFKDENPLKADLKLYRRTSVNYFEITAWPRYKCTEVWRHEYARE